MTFSLLNHHTSDETISSTLQCYIDAFEYIRLRRPAVFLFENVANLLSCARFRPFLSHVLRSVRLLGYAVYMSVLCPTAVNTTFRCSRPRLHILAFLPSDT